MGPLTMIVVLGGGLLLILGGLVGHSLSQHLMTQQIREQARVRREIGERWRVLQAERADDGQHGPGCPGCLRASIAAGLARDGGRR